MMRQRFSKSIRLSVLALCFTLAGPSAVWAALQAQAGSYRVELWTEPAVVPTGQAKLILKITDSAGEPVTDARVRVIAQMPGMAMGEREETALPQTGQPGTYTAPARFSMAGAYEATITIDGPQGTATAKIPLRTGQNTGGVAAGGGFPLFTFLPWMLVALLVMFVLYRMWQTGQQVNLRGLLDWRIVVGILLLVMVYLGSRWVVARYTKPGHMSVIEAQAMDMTVMKPPVGAVPVAVTAAKRQPIDATVTYTGSVVPYVDQDVYPRVTGWIRWMPFYPGDQVWQGQVLARLDTAELQSRVNEQVASRSMAEHALDIAQRQYRQALAARTQAQAQVAEARNDLASIRSELAGARQEAQAAAEERVSALAELEGAQAGIEDAQAELAAARADQEYWAAQLKRSQALYASGAISLQEHQQDRAQAENANAKVRQAQARLRQVNATIRSAKSRVNRVERMLAAAQARVSAMEAKVQAGQAKMEQAQANVRALDAAVETAFHEIEHKKAGVQEATARLTTTRVVAGYTEIRSEVDGVVTQRLISPGVLVSPGQAILKISQISPIRLQANVAESDMANIRVGNRVRVRSHRDPTQVVLARVSSIFPAADPVARTGIVEAIIPNKDHHFVPGQYITMDITTGEKKSALVVPASALVWLPKASSTVLAIEQTPAVWVVTGGQAEKTHYTCPMHPEVKQEKPGKCPSCKMDLTPQVAGGKWRAHLTEVTVGLVNKHYVEIRSGLKEGDQVIYAGHEMLKEGDPIVPTQWGPSGPLTVPPPTGEKERTR